METTAAAAAAVRKEQSSRPLFPLLNLVVTEPFYLFHLAVFFSYFAARSSAPSELSHGLLQREIQAVLGFLVLAAVKIVKEETWEAFIADSLFYAKGFLFALAVVIDHHLGLCYLLAFLVIFVLTQQPPYDGVGDSVQLTPLQLETILTEENTSGFWLVSCADKITKEVLAYVEFITGIAYARLNFEFRALQHAFVQVAYSNKHLSFGIVDLGHFPNVAEKFGISLSGQQSTYILFDKFVEVARFPESPSESQAPTRTVTKSTLCRHFDLDLRLLEYISTK